MQNFGSLRSDLYPCKFGEAVYNFTATVRNNYNLLFYSYNKLFSAGYNLKLCKMFPATTILHFAFYILHLRKDGELC